jgi:hypothetical protein
VSKRAAWAVLILSAAAVAVLFVIARERAGGRRRLRGGAVVRARSAAPLQLAPGPLPPPPAEKTRVTLFFVSKDDGLLRPEERDVEKPVDAVGFARTIMREEAAGPKDPALLPAFPEGLTLRNAFVPGDGRVVVDLNVAPAWAKAAGSADELACVGAVVDAMLQNLAQTDRVQILVNGSAVETLAGHVDISRPLPAMKDVMGAAAAAPASGPGEAPASGPPPASGSEAPTATSPSAPSAAPPGKGTATPAPPPPPSEGSR